MSFRHEHGVNARDVIDTVVGYVPDADRIVLRLIGRGGIELGTYAITEAEARAMVADILEIAVEAGWVPVEREPVN